MFVRFTTGFSIDKTDFLYSLGVRIWHWNKATPPLLGYL